MRTSLLRLAAAVASFAWCGFAVAAGCTTYTIQDVRGTFPSRDAACQAWGAAQYGGAPGITFEVDADGYCRVRTSSGLTNGKIGITQSNDPNCDQCTNNDGKTQVTNFTVGWARSATQDADDHIGAVTFPKGSVCVAGCTWSVTDSGVAAYRSMVPTAQGLHRLSVDFTLRAEGSSKCTPSESDKAADPARADATCPGYVGEVNGRTVCVGTAAKPVGSPLGPSAGRQAGGTEAAGNPAAGNKPSSGAGSGNDGAGRTPSTGSGGNSGGPAAAAAGGVNGTTNKPADGKEQAACGAPGQPKCGIDETGTPRAEKNQFDNAADKYKTDMDSNREKISGASDKGFFEGWRSFWWAPPVVGCQPFQLPSILGLSLPDVDACAVVEGVRTVMGVLWALAGFIFCMRMIALTIRGN